MKLTPELLEAVCKAAEGIEHGNVTIAINSKENFVDVISVKRYFKKFGGKFEKLGRQKESRRSCL